MRRYIGANALALVFYIVYPMAPPWMAWEEGYLSHEVCGSRWPGPTWAWPLPSGAARCRQPGGGEPALHAGMAFMIAVYGILRLRSVWRWLLLLFLFLMRSGRSTTASTTSSTSGRLRPGRRRARRVLLVGGVPG